MVDTVDIAAGVGPANVVATDDVSTSAEGEEDTLLVVVSLVVREDGVGVDLSEPPPSPNNLCLH